MQQAVAVQPSLDQMEFEVPVMIRMAEVQGEVGGVSPPTRPVPIIIGHMGIFGSASTNLLLYDIRDLVPRELGREIDEQEQRRVAMYIGGIKREAGVPVHLDAYIVARNPTTMGMVFRGLQQNSPDSGWEMI